ncbi:hypothetical protein CCFV1_ORF019 [Cotesia congregata filamentous virus 1]|uniref:Uncharacterized protein n=1 Tax=Cotesia congregata filamentous virus 1 TaxID=3064291 RepID=A0ABC8QMT0_9VIRU|nr:hypothetical protein CCFV1_ORF019 [Cotesia congregata filamentous virus 1]
MSINICLTNHRTFINGTMADAQRAYQEMNVFSDELFDTKLLIGKEMVAGWLSSIENNSIANQNYACVNCTYEQFKVCLYRGMNKFIYTFASVDFIETLLHAHLLPTTHNGATQNIVLRVIVEPTLVDYPFNFQLLADSYVPAGAVIPHAVMTSRLGLVKTFSCLLHGVEFCIPEILLYFTTVNKNIYTTTPYMWSTTFHHDSVIYINNALYRENMLWNVMFRWAHKEYIQPLYLYHSYVQPPNPELDVFEILKLDYIKNLFVLHGKPQINFFISPNKNEIEFKDYGVFDLIDAVGEKKINLPITIGKLTFNTTMLIENTDARHFCELSTALFNDYVFL